MMTYPARPGRSLVPGFEGKPEPLHTERLFLLLSYNSTRDTINNFIPRYVGYDAGARAYIGSVFYNQWLCRATTTNCASHTKPNIFSNSYISRNSNPGTNYRPAIDLDIMRNDASEIHDHIVREATRIRNHTISKNLNAFCDCRRWSNDRMRAYESTDRQPIRSKFGKKFFPSRNISDRNVPCRRRISAYSVSIT